ncbi:unnamed protein product, partial [Mesorhabditis belari]|uniref:Glycosyltransferase family 92 protein n=1 Tax=Mesorhabditis belari TaxID=2138241 RepID=A0AAF3EI19_9BILA
MKKTYKKNERFIFACILASVFLVYYFTYSQQNASVSRAATISQLTTTNVANFMTPERSNQPSSVKEATAEPTVKANKFIEISPGNYAFLAIIDRRDVDPSFPEAIKDFLLPKILNGAKALISLFQNTELVNTGNVRVLMALTRSKGFSCQFNDGSKITGEMVLQNNNGGKGKKLFYMYCVPPQNIDLETIDEIRIWDEQSMTSVAVPISYKIQDEGSIAVFPQTFSICVPFLYGEKYSAKDFVEFMEANRLLGVDQISIYSDDSLNEKLKMVMKEYSKEGLLENIPFSMPFDSADVHYYGQFLTITDCLLRHNGRTEFVSFQDLDEFVIPKANNNNQSIENRLTLIPKLFSNKNRASLRLKVIYVFPEGNELPITLNSHEQIDYADEISTKCIVRPHYVLEPFIHEATSFVRWRYVRDYADTNDMVLFHYKSKEASISRINAIRNEEKERKVINTNYYFMDYFSNISRVFNEKCKQLGL